VQKKRKLQIGIFSYDGAPELQTMHCVISTLIELSIKGMESHITARVGNADVAGARNSMVGEFLSGDCTDLLMLDHDVAWEPGAVLRLMHHPVDLVCGAYRARKDPEQYPIRCLGKEIWSCPDTGLIEVEGLGAGFMRITRKCLEDMVKAYESRRYYDEWFKRDTWSLFDFVSENGFRWSEDIMFCKRYRDIGGKVWVDPELTLHHVGKKTFTGTFGHWLKANAPLHAPSEADRLKALLGTVQLATTKALAGEGPQKVEAVA
jgi:hypothetical protein